MIFTTLTIEIRNFSIMFLARRTFDLKEDKLELEYHSENLMMKRDLYRYLQKPRNNTRISFVYYRNQLRTSIRFFSSSFKVELMLLLAIVMRLKSFIWYSLRFANKRFLWKVELWQHINMKHNNKFYLSVKSSNLTVYRKILVIHFNPTILQNL